MFIFPEVRVFVYMDQLETWLNYSISHRFEPEIECMVMVIEDRNNGIRVRDTHKMPESLTCMYDTIFDLFENDLISDFDIRKTSLYHSRNHKIWISSTHSRPLLIGKSIVSLLPVEYV
jgi:hypothetical protein